VVKQISHRLNFCSGRARGIASSRSIGREEPPLHVENSLCGKHDLLPCEQRIAGTRSLPMLATVIPGTSGSLYRYPLFAFRYLLFGISNVGLASEARSTAPYE
jgi:hypothetical protein